MDFRIVIGKPYSSSRQPVPKFKISTRTRTNLTLDVTNFLFFIFPGHDGISGQGDA